MIFINLKGAIDSEENRVTMELWGGTSEICSVETFRRVLDEHPDEQEVCINIDCDGGSVEEGFKIYDLLRMSGRTIYTNIVGDATRWQCASCWQLRQRTGRQTGIAGHSSTGYTCLSRIGSLPTMLAALPRSLLWRRRLFSTCTSREQVRTGNGSAMSCMRSASMMPNHFLTWDSFPNQFIQHKPNFNAMAKTKKRL